MFKEFLDLRRKPDLRRSLPDLLNYGFPEDDFTIVMKDLARLKMFECVGPDLNSASEEELDAHRLFANRALLWLDEEFAWQIDYIRYPSAPRPQRQFPDPVSAMIPKNMFIGRPVSIAAVNNRSSSRSPGELRLGIYGVSRHAS